jgi:hypothetical protein
MSKISKMSKVSRMSSFKSSHGQLSLLNVRNVHDLHIHLDKIAHAMQYEHHILGRPVRGFSMQRVEMQLLGSLRVRLSEKEKNRKEKQGVGLSVGTCAHAYCIKVL